VAKARTDIDVVDQAEKLDTMRVENLVQKYLSAQNLNVLPEIELADAVRIYVEKDEKDAVKEYVMICIDYFSLENALDVDGSVDSIHGIPFFYRIDLSNRRLIECKRPYGRNKTLKWRKPC